MMDDRKTLSETWQPEGFVLRVEMVETPDWGFEAITDDAETHEAVAEFKDALERSPAFMEMESAYTLAGDYIGDIKTARYLCGEMGIKPEKRKPDHNVCSIGFNEAEQKWYGWSHRAIHGFGIGDEVRKGQIAYVPADPEAALEDAIRFWEDEFHASTTARESVDADGRKCIEVEWVYTDTVPNAKLRGTTGGTRYYPPANGRGEWKAETLDDARKMAEDFAENIS
jgi:hypothetical protein